MSEHCEHGFAEGRRCPVCCDPDAGKEPKRRSVYEDRPVVEVDEEWRAEQLRSIGLPIGWRPLDEFLAKRPSRRTSPAVARDTGRGAEPRACPTGSRFGREAAISLRGQTIRGW